ncbi:MAG: hypothetical protein RH982_06115 [Parvibaculum sp.]
MTVKMVVPRAENTLFAARMRAALAFSTQIVAGVVAGMAFTVNLGSNAGIGADFPGAASAVKKVACFLSKMAIFCANRLPTMNAACRGQDFNYLIPNGFRPFHGLA